jgi:proton translocating ATP synthase F1 alpha subunit
MNNKVNLNSQTSGRIVSIADGIAIVSGMGGVMSGEVVIFNENGSKVQGLVLTLAQDHICVVVLGNNRNLTTAASVFRTGTVISFPVGFNLLGCVVDGLGDRIDGGSPLNITRFRNVEMKAPGIGSRSGVNEPLLTGILGIDSLIPVGRGQRELIIGDRQTGKTSVAVDAIINQRNVSYSKQVFCIYVAIGQKRSSVIHLAKRLKKKVLYFIQQ